LSVIDRCLLFRARADVLTVRVDYSGQATWVLKDPATLELYHLTAEEYFLFAQLRQPTSMGQLQRQFEQAFPPRRISIGALQAFCDQLCHNGLLLSDQPGQARQLLARGGQRRRQWWLQSTSRLLAIRFPGVDAERLFDWPLFDWLKHKSCWFFSRGMLYAVILLGIGAVATLVGNWSEMVSELPSLSTLLEPRYLLTLMASVVAVKLLHELAHAVVCKQLGGQVREMGVMLLALMPVLYCDVSDAWRFPNKWHRIAISAAGIGMELVLAALAILVWSVTEPGLLHVGCLNVAMVSSLGTLLVNANPLLRYDGYYLLADWLEVPNLSSRGREWLARALRGWLLGEPAMNDPLLSPAKQRVVAFYAIGARLYLAVVLIGLYLIFSALARPYHLENLVSTLAIVLLAVYLASTSASWGKWLLNPSVRGRIRGRRLALLGTVATGLVAVVLGWPIRRQVSAPVVIVPEENAHLHATEAGILAMALPSGAHVEAGDVVARLTNPQLEQELALLADRCEVERLRREQLQVLRVWDDRVARQLPAVEAALADAEVQLAQQRERAKRLVLLASRAGQVLAPPSVVRSISSHEPTTPRELMRWSGSLLQPRNAGAWVEPGTLVATVADPQRLEAWVAVAQKDVAQVAPRQSVQLVLETAPSQILEGEVELVAQRATHPASDSAPSSAPMGLESSYHLVRVRLRAKDAQLWIGARGQAKIETSATTLAATLVRHLRATFRLPW
jgi:putative peptide zinc metalloprotease protein